jgi:hypothetical protein
MDGMNYSRLMVIESIAIRQFGSFSFGSLAHFRSAVWLISIRQFGALAFQELFRAFALQQRTGF